MADDLYAVVKSHMDQSGMSLRGLAKAVHCDPSYLSKTLRGLKPLGPKLARDIDTALSAGGEITSCAARSGVTDGPGAGAAEAVRVMEWLTSSNTSDDAIGELGRAAVYLAEVHGRMPAVNVLREVLGVYAAAHALLRGRQRMAQMRELLRIDSALLAHACVLISDLGAYEAARAYGNASLLCAQEADTDEGLAWTALAKTARWQDRFTETAGMAARGFQASSEATVRVELAYREANAYGLFGDTPRARAALERAGRTSDSVAGLDGDGVWSFSRGRQAIFTLSICVHTGDPDGALRAAGDADAYWAAGGGRVTATWAQVRAGAAMAYLMKNSLDGAAQQLAPVLELPVEQRIATVTGYLDGINAMLAARKFAGPAAAELGEQIRVFTASAAGPAS